MEFVPQSAPTLGCEWELQLIRDDSLELADGVLAIMGRLPKHALIKPEFLQCCIELNTPPCNSVEEIEQSLGDVLSTVLELASQFDLKLAGAGTHPFDRKPAIVFPARRYLRMAEAHSLAPVHPVTFATHVHVACKDGDAAMRAMRRLTPCIPLLLGLGANSPFWHGLNTGYVSFRQRLLASNPTYGLPPYFGSWSDYNATLSAARASHTIDNFRDLHWDIRPHGDFGTIEIRTFDAQIDVRRNAELAAFVRALVVLAADEDTDDRVFPQPLPHWIEIENHFRATKYGLEAELIVERDGQVRPALAMMDELVALVRPVAEGLGDGPWLGSLSRSLIDGNGAHRQRRAWEHRHSAKDVTGLLVSELGQARVDAA